MPRDLGPGVPVALEPLRNRGNRPAVGAGGGVVELLPVQRRGDGRVRPGADRVRRDRRVGVSVSLDVDQDLALTLGLALLVGEQARLAARRQPSQLAREPTHFVEPRSPLERHDDVVAARAGGHHPRLEPDLAQQRAEDAGGAPDLGRLLPGGIEIDHQPVGTVEPVAAAEPLVQRHACLAREVYERRGLRRDHVHDRVVPPRHLRAADPRREVVRGPLLHDPLALDPVRIALQVERAPRDVVQHGRRDPLVVAGQVGLRDPRGEERLVGPGDLDLAATRLDRDAHDGTSRTTSRAGLSSRSPW